MNNLEIRKAAYKLYWEHSKDVSGYDEKYQQAILEDLSIIRANEDKANETVDHWLTDGRPDRRFSYGL